MGLAANADRASLAAELGLHAELTKRKAEYAALTGQPDGSVGDGGGGGGAPADRPPQLPPSQPAPSPALCHPQGSGEGFLEGGRGPPLSLLLEHAHSCVPPSYISYVFTRRDIHLFFK